MDFYAMSSHITCEQLALFWSDFVLEVLVCLLRPFYVIYKRASEVGIYELKIWRQ
jgi:hypothetical protein